MLSVMSDFSTAMALAFAEAQKVRRRIQKCPGQRSVLSRSQFTPHQGEREKARRRKQIAAQAQKAGA